MYSAPPTLSHTAVQAGTQVQARDQAGEEAEADGSRWAEGSWKGRYPYQEASCHPYRWAIKN